jgi:CRP/FNR family transcriptional regulator
MPDLQLPGIDPATAQALVAIAARAALPAGSVLFRPGDACTQFFILLAGSVRVHRLARSGREMVLYHVRAGESCILTTLCLLSAEAYSAGAIVEQDVQALAVPQAGFNGLMNSSEGFRRLVFTSYAQRMADLMERIEALSDTPVDMRLAGFLLECAGPTGIVLTTHQALATEIGTAREVVSRALGRLEQLGVLQLSRGKIDIRDRYKLELLA